MMRRVAGLFVLAPAICVSVGLLSGDRGLAIAVIAAITAVIAAITAWIRDPRRRAC